MQLRRLSISTPDSTITQKPTPVGQIITIPPSEARRALVVLRLKKGEEVTLISNWGTALGRIIACSKTPKPNMEVELLTPFTMEITNSQPILALALLRPGPFDWAVEKAVELGCGKLVPLITSRTRTQDLDGNREANKLLRWQKILQSALKQSERSSPMEISPPITLESFLDPLKPITIEKGPSQAKEAIKAAPKPPRLLLDPKGDPFPKELALSPILLIGPEGGFTVEEKEEIKAASFIPVSLGPHILRAETCALAALAACLIATQKDPIT
jgi:16S rRNA (uracil1498-N3)-methyltransferase